MNLPDSSVLLKLLETGNDDLHDLYRELMKATPYGNQAERDEVKSLVMKLHYRIADLRRELWDYREGEKQP